MRTIQLSDEDAVQVKAILLTHAEMSDRGAIPSMELLGRIRRDEDQADPEIMEMIDTLTEQVGDFEHDSDNLKRLALLF